MEVEQLATTQNQMARPQVAPVSLQERILETAVAAVRHGGAEGLTMRSLADRLGYSPATLYLHFRNKQALLEAVADQGFAQLEAAIDEKALAAGPDRALGAAVEAYVSFAIDEAQTYRLMFRTPLPEGADPGPRRRVFQRLQQEIARSGGVPAGSETAALRRVWSFLHGRLELGRAGILGGPEAAEAPENLAREALSLLRS